MIMNKEIYIDLTQENTQAIIDQLKRGGNYRFFVLPDGSLLIETMRHDDIDSKNHDQLVALHKMPANTTGGVLYFDRFAADGPSVSFSQPATTISQASEIQFLEALRNSRTLKFI